MFFNIWKPAPVKKYAWEGLDEVPKEIAHFIKDKFGPDDYDPFGSLFGHNDYWHGHDSFFGTVNHTLSSLLGKGDYRFELNEKLPKILLNASIDDNMTKPDGTVLTGSGIPSDGWQIMNNYKVQIGEAFGWRTGNFEQVHHIKNTADGPILVYYGEADHQKPNPAENVSTEHTGRNAMTEGYSVSLGHEGAPIEWNDFFAAGGWVTIATDLDPSLRTDFDILYAGLDATLNPDPSHIVLYDENGVPRVIDSKGTVSGFQNFDNLSFHQIDTDPNTPGVQTGGDLPAGTYDRVIMVGIGDHVLGELHSQYVLS